MSCLQQRASPARSWTFSWAGAPQDWEPLVEASFGNTSVKGWIASPTSDSQSQGDCLKGFVTFAKKVRKSSLKIPNGMVLKVAKNGARNAIKELSDKRAIAKGCCLQEKEPENDACSSSGLPPSVCPNITLRPWQEDIVTILRKEPDDRIIHWVWEPLGCTGKTTFQKWLFHEFEGTVVLSGKAVDMKHNVTQYAAKNHNVPRSQDRDCLSWQGIEEIKDMFFFSPKYEGGMVCGAAPHVVIFSNQAPPQEKLSKDRWQIHRLSEQQLKSETALGFAITPTKPTSAKSVKRYNSNSSMDDV